MKVAPLKEIKSELKDKTKEEVVELCLLMTKYKKVNKELLTYLLYDKQDEGSYVQDIKHEIDDQFESINMGSYYFINKGVRKALRISKKFIRYSKNKETEAEVLIYFCSKVKEVSGYYEHNTTLMSIYDKQLEIVRKKITGLHEDLQYDYNLMIDEVLGESEL
ncbi:MAG: hypothetical protein ACJAZ2_001160 [Glaciecola sp.]|jgi:hypothetical protein